MDNSIGDILNGEPEAEPETVAEQVEEQPEAAEALETIERPRGPDGKFIPKEPTGVQEQETPAEPVPPTEPTDRLPQAEYAALRDERRKRQELEQRLQALETQRLHAAQPKAPDVDFWDDPQTFLAKQFDQFSDQMMQRFTAKQQVERLDASEAAARSKYPDYDEKFEAFHQAVQLNPKLAQELARASDPGEFAYSRGKTALEIEKAGSIDALIQSERAKWEAEMRAVIQPTATLPPTTAGDSSVGARTGPAWAGPKPLGDILS
jgi:hypothetical protein